MSETDIYDDVKPDQARIDAILPLVRGMARDHIARTMTDFLGRMNEAVMTADDCCPDGVLDEERQDEYNEMMIELASLALAQAAMSARPLHLQKAAAE